MNYKQAEKTLRSALKFGIDASLEPIRLVCDALGKPQRAYLCVQIAGTNGKSSVSRMIACLLRAAGLRVGLYTSPELVRYPERMEIDGKVVSDQRFADAIDAAVQAGNRCGLQLTEFELLTAGALWLFAKEKIDVCVLECGLGGRWDATSVCVPCVSVITGVGYDHTHILGNTLEEIATEKAAIIKPGVRSAVLAPGLECREIFASRALSCVVRVIDVDEKLANSISVDVSHMPNYQQNNAAVALEAARALFYEMGVDSSKLHSNALRKLQIPGRFEVLRNNPLLIIDAAHNPQSAQVLADELKRRNLDLTLVIGVLADKDARGIVNALVHSASKVVVTQSKGSRALSASELSELVRERAVKPVVTKSVEEALRVTKTEPTIATGSITIAGEVKANFTR